MTDSILSPGTPPPIPSVDVAAIGKLIREELDRNNKYLEFAQAQIEKDRSFYKHLYVFAGSFIAVMIAVSGYFQYASVNQMRSDMKASVDTELGRSKAEIAALRAQALTTSAEAQSTVGRELANVRTEVQKRIDTEFRNENITSLVSSVAKQRTENELAAIIRSETSAQVAKGIQEQGPAIKRTVEDQTREAVNALQPTISSIISDELGAQVKKSVAPVEAQMKAYGELITTGTLCALAKNGDRKSFDQLFAIGFMGATSPSEEAKVLAQTTVRDIIRQKNNPPLRLSLQFREKQTPDAMKTMLKSSKVREERLAALDNFPPNDTSILPLLVEVIKSDDDLDVVANAIRVFDNLTKQSFEFPNFPQVLEWWNKNRTAFDQDKKP
jgi:hypothetical protein